MQEKIITCEIRENSGMTEIIRSLSGRIKNVILEILAIRKKPMCVERKN